MMPDMVDVHSYTRAGERVGDFQKSIALKAAVVLILEHFTKGPGVFVENKRNAICISGKTTVAMALLGGRNSQLLFDIVLARATLAINFRLGKTKDDVSHHAGYAVLELLKLWKLNPNEAGATRAKSMDELAEAVLYAWQRKTLPPLFR